MAKDDYDVIVYRILVYYYACLKRKISFDNETFRELVSKHTDSEGYFNDILDMMQREGFIEGLSFHRAWGRDLLLTSDLDEARITPEGIHYLKENSAMAKAAEFLKNGKDLIAGLATSLLERE